LAQRINGFSPFGDPVADQERHRRRDEGDGQDHGAQQGGHHGEGHRMKHLPLHAGEGEDRQVHHHDDELAEQQRPARLFSGREHLVKALVAGQARPAVACICLCMGKPPHAVLHDHHGAVDDDAEVQRPQAHQVGADPVRHHAGEGEQHRQRDHQGGDDRRADVAEEQEQDCDHQQGALDQVLLDRVDGLVDQDGAVIDRLRHHAGWQGAVDLVKTCRATACETVRLFSPISMNTVPSTTSRPFSVAAPVRSSRPRPTSATS
jgi:hypothetical protein